MRLRIVSYNLMDGGVGRADPLAEVLLAQRADIIGLTEAGDLTVLRRLSTRLGMEFVCCHAPLGTVAILSKHCLAGVVNTALLRGLKSPALRATVRAQGSLTTVDVLDIRGDDALALADDPLPAIKCVSQDVAGVEQPTKGDPPRFVSQVWPGEDVRVVDHWIETDRLAAYASDHFPSGLEIVL
jgi:hypothetical protein